MRLFWLGLITVFLAVPAAAQTPPPAGDALVRASAQAENDLAAANATDPLAIPTAPAIPTVDRALTPEEAAMEAQAKAAAEAAEREANTQAELAEETDVPTTQPQQVAQQMAQQTAQQTQQRVAPEPIVNEPTTTIARLEQNAPQAASDALARALAEQARRAAEQTAALDAQQAEIKLRQNQEAFDGAQKRLFPLTTDQIRETMRKYEEEQYAKVPPAYGQPKPEIAVTTVSLDPGAEPPEIKVHSGFVTTMAILDASGQPWPIQDIGIGGNFDIPNPESGSHIVRISPLSHFGFGNLSIRLKDLPTPVTFRLSAGNDVVHYRYDARIPRMGPNARMSLIQRQKLTAGDDVIMSVLDNAIPEGTKKLKVSGTDTRTRAYRVGERVFVRTPLTLLSPSWNASVSSADGTTVYEVGETPVLLLSDQGAMVRAKITEEDAS